MPRKRKTPPDGRANNGGVRQGTPGRLYPNRTDLTRQPVQTAQGQGYGKAAAQARAQAAVPVAGAPAPQAFAGAPTAPTMGVDPGGFGDFLRPTERPDEPVTAGAPVGPGPGPGVLPPTGDTTIDELRAIYQLSRSETIREILEDLEREQGWGM